jgi:uncharacterized protein YjiS (DUF1127 family)
MVMQMFSKRWRQTTDCRAARGARRLPAVQPPRPGAERRLGAGRCCWQERATQRHRLSMAEQRMLEDVGLTRAAVAPEIRKLFWRV